MSYAYYETMRHTAKQIDYGTVTGLRNLKKIREAKGLTQKGMAWEIGANEDTYRGWERMAGFPNARWLPAICAALNCKLEELF